MKTAVLGSRIFWKLYAGYVILILLAASVIGVLVSGRVEDDRRIETRRSLEGTSRLLLEISAPTLAGVADPESFRLLVDRLGVELETRLTVIARDGRVVADSHDDPESMDDHSGRPEVREARTTGTGSAVRFSRTRREEMMYVARPVEQDGELIGYIRAAVSLQSLNDELAGLRRLVAAGAAIGAVVALVLGFLVGRRVLLPLVSMTSGARAMADGDFSQRLSENSHDEIGEFSRSFNDMARLLEERVATITNQRNTLQATLGGLIEGVVAVDSDENVVHMNRSAESILDLPPGRSLGRPIWEVTRVAAVAETLARCVREQTEVQGEARMVRPEGSRVVELHAVPLRDGGVVGAVLVLHDVSEKRRLEAVRREFVSNVSHELKTPVTAIIGSVETLIDDEQMTAENRSRFLSKIHSQTLRLAALIADILELSRLEQAPDAVDLTRLDLSEPVCAEFESLREAADRKSIALRFELPDGEIPVAANAEALRRLVSNLLDNAIKFSPEGGAVTVRVTVDDDTADLEVADDGPGIEAKHLDRIFERFYRVDPGRSRELGGTGLGLAIVKHIALAHAAEVSLESESGRGSTFHVRFPLVS